MRDEVTRWGRKIYCRYLDNLKYGFSICLSQWMQTNKMFMDIKVIINPSYANHQLFSVRHISCFIGDDGVNFADLIFAATSLISFNAMTWNGLMNVSPVKKFNVVDIIC